MLPTLFKYLYHIKKPRVLSANDISLIKYRKLMRQTRRKLHVEANQYQEQIETEFLKTRHQNNLKKHRDNERRYRTQIIRNGYLLSRNLEEWKKRDEVRDQRLNNYIHKEHLAKINRDRILKILNHESDNFWFNEHNLQERLTEQHIVPAYAGSSEYYHKLTCEALAYQQFNIDEFEDIRSDQSGMSFKNKLLIPIYSEILKLVKIIKTTEFSLNEDRYKQKLQQINILLNLPEFDAERERQIQFAQQEYNRNKEHILKKMEQPKNRNQFIKEKITQIKCLLAYWKNYAKVINMTSAEIKAIKKLNEDLTNQKTELENLQKMSKVKLQEKQAYVDAKQKNTEDQEVDLKQFFETKKQQNFDQLKINQQNMKELDDILANPQPIYSSVKQPESYKISSQLERYTQELNKKPKPLSIDENDRFKENTSVLIETWKEMTDDPQIIKSLDEIGEVSIEQAQLFWKVWEMK